MLAWSGRFDFRSLRCWALRTSWEVTLYDVPLNTATSYMPALAGNNTK